MSFFLIFGILYLQEYRPGAADQGREYMNTEQIVLLVLALTVALAVMIFFAEREKKQPRRARTNVGADSAAKILRSFASRNSCRVLGPVTLAKGEQTAKLDAVLVGWFGVLGVKSFGYNGQVFGNPRDEQWLWSCADRRENFANPAAECALAARLMREALMNAGVRSPQVEAVYVFTDPQVELAIPRDTPAMKPADLRALLRKDSYTTDRGYDLEQLCSVLRQFEEK